MKVLLVNLPSESIRKPEEHCGLACLKAYVEKHGIQVDILDAYARNIDMTNSVKIIENWLRENVDTDSFIGISPFVTSHENFVTLGKKIREISNKTIIFAGGHYATLNKEYLMREFPWLDAIIVGEGELSLLEMIQKPFSCNVKGVYKRQYMDDFKPRERILDLDSIPYQARYMTQEELNGQPYTITTSRGCYGDCSFCSISSFYNTNGKIKQTFRSAKSVSDEIHLLVDKYGIESLKIVDDNFFRDKSDEFLDEMVSLLGDLKLSFRLSARPNDITETRAKKLREMGAKVIAIGAESAHEESLNLFNKGIGISCSYDAINILNRNNITCLVNFIMFNPIIDVDGLWQNCCFVEEHSDTSLFHRINSHLWIRTTDPIVNKLVEMGLCDRKGFPYLDSRYASEDVSIIKELFDIWCENNMKEYYTVADVLMAKGIAGNEKEYEYYKRLLKQDIEILKHLIDLSKENEFRSKGKRYISECMRVKNENIFD